MAVAKLNDLAPLTEDDETIRKALKEAHIPSLMAASSTSPATSASSAATFVR